MIEIIVYIQLYKSCVNIDESNPMSKIFILNLYRLLSQNNHLKLGAEHKQSSSSFVIQHLIRNVQPVQWKAQDSAISIIVPTVYAILRLFQIKNLEW